MSQTVEDNAVQSKTVSLERVGDVAVLTMGHAPYNLMGGVLAGALREALARAVDEGARAIVLRSRLRHFSAGAELSMFDDQGATLQEELDPIGLLQAIEENPLPIVASVHGIAVGGGFELALASDFIVAASSSKFELVEATLGLHPLMGGIQRVMQRAGAARGKEMVMFGRRYDAATLEKWGIVNRVVPDAQLQDLTMAFAQELALGPTVAHGCTKKLANIYLRDGMAAADAAMAEVEKPISRSQDLITGLKTYREKGAALATFVGK